MSFGHVTVQSEISSLYKLSTAGSLQDLFPGNRNYPNYVPTRGTRV